jgi:hypothetical protein
MLLSHKSYILTLNLSFLCILFFGLLSCDSYLRSKPDITAIAKLGDQFLYREDIPSFLYENSSPEDSTAIVKDYINQWAAKQLLIQKAVLNLPLSKIEEFDRLVSNYKADLYTLAYKEALVNARTDSIFTSAEMLAFYEQEKQNFKLKEKIIRLRFVELPLGFRDKKIIVKKIKDFSEADIIYLDSISIQFNGLNLNDSSWVPMSRVIREIGPLSLVNEDDYLKKSQFFELQDSLGLYLGQVIDVLPINATAPLNYIYPSLEQVLKIRRKQDFLKQIERDIINEAIKNRSLEIYN